MIASEKIIFSSHHQIIYRLLEWRTGKTDNESST